MPIPYKILKSGFKLPAIGLGTWLMGGDTTRIESPQDAIDITAIRTAIDLGFTHIDTAEIYGDGHAEEIIATAIGAMNRENLCIATKAKQGHHTYPLLTAALDSSLKRLQTDYIDLYYLHQPTLDTPLEETADALNAAHRAGKIKSVGVCNFTADRLDKLQSFLKPKIVANQVHYNLSFREPEKVGLLNHAIDKDYFVVAWRPLRLKRRNQNNPAVSYNIWEKGVSPIVDEMANKYNLSNTQIALLWTTAHSHVTTLIKSSNPAHLKEAVDSFKTFIPSDDIAKLSKDFVPQYDISDTIALI